MAINTFFYKTIAKTSPVYQHLKLDKDHVYNTRLHLEWNGKDVRLMWKDHIDKNLPNITTGISIKELSNLLSRAYKKPHNVTDEKEKEVLKKQLFVFSKGLFN